MSYIYFISVVLMEGSTCTAESPSVQLTFDNLTVTYTRDCPFQVSYDEEKICDTQTLYWKTQQKRQPASCG